MQCHQTVTLSIQVRVDADTEEGIVHATQQARKELFADAVGYNGDVGAYSYRTLERGRKVLHMRRLTR